MKEVMCIRDAKGEMWFTPMFVASKGAGIRSFGDIVNLSDSAISAHPEDYAIFHLGSFDDHTGMMKINKQPEHIMNALEMKKEDKQLKFTETETKKENK